MNNLQLFVKYAKTIEGARRRRKKFELSILTLKNILEQTHCAYSGELFTEENPLTLERINNNIGYVDGNVIPVCHELNHFRGHKENEVLLEELNASCKRLVELSDENHVSEAERTYILSNKILADGGKHYPEETTLWKNIKTAKKNIVSFKAEINKLKDQEINLNLPGQYSKTIKKLEAKILRTENNIASSNVVLENTILAINKALKNKNYLDELKVNNNLAVLLQSGLKFSSLSKLQKLKLKLGLPLDTPLSKVLKCSVQYNVVRGIL